MKRLLCRIGFHSFGKWETHPLKANWITKQCKRCKRIDDRRLF